MAQHGETLARQIADAMHAPVTDTTAIQAIPTYQRFAGMLCIETTNGTLWRFCDTSTAVAGPTVLVPASGSGRWHSAGGTGGVGVGTVHISSVRGASDAALAAYTRTGNVILADAVGSINPEDGLTLAVGDRYLLKDGAAGADNGLYRIDVVGDGSTEYQMTRVGDADATAEVTAGMLVYVSEGTANGDDWFYLSTDDPIVLNTTSLAFVRVPTLTELTSVETRLSTEECARSDTDSSVDSVETRLSTEESDRSDADASLTTRLSTEECARSDTDSSLDSVETRLSTEECARSDTDSSVDSVETRLSTEECARSDTDSSVDSVETRLSTEECARSDTDSSVDSVETRLSTEECARSDTDSSVDSIETRLSTEECARSDTDSSVGSIETRVSVEESARVLTEFKLLATATITSADLTTAGVGPETENIGAVMNDTAVPLACRASLTDAFDNGAGVSLNMTIGWSGDNDRYITNFDCYTGSALEGTGWEQGTPNTETQLGLPADSTQITAEFTAGGDQLTNFTNGSVTIEIWGLDHA